MKRKITMTITLEGTDEMPVQLRRAIQWVAAAGGKVSTSMEVLAKP